MGRQGIGLPAFSKSVARNILRYRAGIAAPTQSGSLAQLHREANAAQAEEDERPGGRFGNRNRDHRRPTRSDDGGVLLLIAPLTGILSMFARRERTERCESEAACKTS